MFHYIGIGYLFRLKVIVMEMFVIVCLPFLDHQGLFFLDDESSRKKSVSSSVTSLTELESE